MNDKNIRINVLISILIFILIAAAVAFLRPGKNRNTVNDSSVEIYKPQITENKLTENSDTRNYTIKLENNMLNFYSNSADGHRLIESSPINTQIYPGEDIKELLSGITVDTLEEGIAVFEDFTT